MNAIVGTNIICLKESINFFKTGISEIHGWFTTPGLEIRAEQNNRSEPFEIVETGS